MQNVTIPQLEKMKQALCDHLKMYCMEQQPLWRMIPYMLIEAQGGVGYDTTSRNAHAYESGYWQIWVSDVRDEMCVACIDLATGKLVQTENKEPVTDIATMLSLLNHLQLIDAGAIVTRLEHEKRREPMPHWGPEELKVLRAKLCAMHDVKPVYERPTGPRPIGG